jgi:hypothetical protein
MAMRKVSPELFSAFEHDQERRFVKKLATVVKEAVPDLRDVPEPAFSAQIRLLIEQARSYGLHAENTIGSFSVTAGLLGVDFVEQHPAVEDILKSNDSEFTKARMLEEFSIQLFRALES